MTSKEITNAMIENAAECNRCTSCNMLVFGSEGNCVRALAAALKAERAKPKVWDGAPDNCNNALVTFFQTIGKNRSVKTYTRELPKSRARIIAEKYAEKHAEAWERVNEKEMIGMIESAINEALEAEK